jgi:hypothetical protein
MRPGPLHGRIAGGLLLAALAVAGCATPQTEALLADPGALPERSEVASAPFYPQERLYCGPAALAMALTWSGLPVTQEEIAPQVYTPGLDGTLVSDILAAARRNGRVATPVGDLQALLAELAAGHPVIVFQNLALDWYPLWHFALAVGYDLAEQVIVLRSGLDARRLTPLATFERTWARGDYWALVVLPPDELPVSADEHAVLRAAAGLERVQHYAAAATAYEAIARRWPASYGASMGLGNARYAQTDFPGAETAYREVIARRADDANAWNNLAYALAAQGRRADAVEAAERAVLHGGDATRYRETLEEIAAGAD